MVKEFWRSVRIRQSYGKKSSGTFFSGHGVVVVAVIVINKKAEHLYSAFHGIQTTLKRSGMDHTVLPAINTIPAVYPVSVHQMAPPPIEAANI